MKRHVRFLTLPKPKRKPPPPPPAVCGECCRIIDLTALNIAREQDRDYVHGCGRVLWKA